MSNSKKILTAKEIIDIAFEGYQKNIGTDFMKPAVTRLIQSHKITTTEFSVAINAVSCLLFINRIVFGDKVKTDVNVVFNEKQTKSFVMLAGYNISMDNFVVFLSEGIIHAILRSCIREKTKRVQPKTGKTVTISKIESVKDLNLIILIICAHETRHRIQHMKHRVLYGHIDQEDKKYRIKKANEFIREKYDLKGPQFIARQNRRILDHTKIEIDARITEQLILDEFEKNGGISVEKLREILLIS